MPDFPRSPSDTLTAATDAIQQGGGRIPYEGLTAATDTSNRLGVFSRAASTTLTAATASVKREAGRKPSDTLTAATDSVTRVQALLRSITDATKAIKDAVLSGKNIGVFAAVINEYLTPATDSLSKKIAKLLSGVVSPTATVGKLRGRTLSGSIAPAGSFIASSVYWSLAGVIKAGVRALALASEARSFILQVTNRKSQ